MALVMAAGLTLGQPTKLPVSRRLRAISYNVQYGKAVDAELGGGADDMRRVLADPSIAGVDVLALQEVCGATDNQLGYFRRAVGSGHEAFHAFAPSDAADKGPCQRGEAIVSRHRIVASGALDLPNVRQPRSAVWADVMLPRSDGTTALTRVYSVHLENRPSGMAWATGRLMQAQAVIEHIRGWKDAHPGEPVMVLGDLNTLGRGWDVWAASEPAVLAFGEFLKPVTTRRVQTHRMLPHQLDWIFFDGMTLRASQVPRLAASDHYPLVADFEMLPPLPQRTRPIAFSR